MKFVVEIPAEQEQAFKQAVKDCNGSCLIGDQDLVYEAIPEARIHRVLEACRSHADPLLQKYYTTENLLPEVKAYVHEQLSDYYLAGTIKAGLEEPLERAKRLETFSKKRGVTPAHLKRAKSLILQKDMDITGTDDAEVGRCGIPSALTSTFNYTVEAGHFPRSLIRTAKELSHDIQYLDDALFLLDPARDADEYRGTYTKTNDINAKPATPKQEKAAKQLGKAITSFSKKMNTIQENITAVIEAEAKRAQVDAKEAVHYGWLPDRQKANQLAVACALSYVDTAKELRPVLPATFRVRTDFEEKDIHLDAPFLKLYESGKKQLDYLRSRTEPTGKESLAEKTMRKVYSENRDTVDYDKLNQETVARLIEKGASDKSIREVAEMAMKLNPTIKDAKKYTKYLLMQANNYRSKATEK